LPLTRMRVGQTLLRSGVNLLVQWRNIASMRLCLADWMQAIVARLDWTLRPATVWAVTVSWRQSQSPGRIEGGMVVLRTLSALYIQHR
jgi:hypothetical protein